MRGNARGGGAAKREKGKRGEEPKQTTEEEIK